MCGMWLPIQISRADLHTTILLCILSEQSGHVFAEVVAFCLLYIHSLKVGIITNFKPDSK